MRSRSVLTLFTNSGRSTFWTLACDCTHLMFALFLKICFKEVTESCRLCSGQTELGGQYTHSIQFHCLPLFLITASLLRLWKYMRKGPQTLTGSLIRGKRYILPFSFHKNMALTLSFLENFGQE